MPPCTTALPAAGHCRRWALGAACGWRTGGVANPNRVDGQERHELLRALQSSNNTQATVCARPGTQSRQGPLGPGRSEGSAALRLPATATRMHCSDWVRGVSRLPQQIMSSSETNQLLKICRLRRWKKGNSCCAPRVLRGTLPWAKCAPAGAGGWLGPTTSIDAIYRFRHRNIRSINVSSQPPHQGGADHSRAQQSLRSLQAILTSLATALNHFTLRRLDARHCKCQSLTAASEPRQTLDTGVPSNM